MPKPSRDEAARAAIARSDRVLEGLPEDRPITKDDLLDVVIAERQIPKEYMLSNKSLLKRLGRRGWIYTIALVAVLAAGTVITIAQLNHNHSESQKTARALHAQTLAAAAQAKRTIQLSRLTSSYTACVQQKLKRKSARALSAEFVAKLSDGSIKSIKPVGTFFREFANAVTLSQARVPAHIPARWITDCRAHAKDVVNSPNTKYPPPPPPA